MRTYDSLLESDPDFQRTKVEGERQGMVKSLLIIVEARFPALLEMAQEPVSRLDTPDALNVLLKQLALAPDEKTARFVLESAAA